MHFIPCAFALALLKAGNNIAARMAMIAMTTRSSIKVKPTREQLLPESRILEIARMLELKSYLSSQQRQRRAM
jgi:hypothetical protein